MRKLKAIIAAIFLMLSMAAKADLFDRGNGLIYDDELDITWVQVANLAAGSSFDDGGGTFGDPSTDGLLTWASATAFVDSLVYAGFDDWRLPAMDVDGDSTIVNCAFVSQADCLDNELGYLYFYSLEGNGGPLTGDTEPFTGILFRYWGSDEVAPSSAWTFDFVGGIQGPVDKNGDALANPAGAWAVRSGDVTAPPNPGPNTYSGNVTVTQGPLAGLFNVGDPGDITISLDQTVADTDPAFDIGQYPNATIEVSVDLPALQLEIRGSGGDVTVRDNLPVPNDQVWIFVDNINNGAQLGGQLINSIQVSIVGTTDMLASDRLIAGFPPNIMRVRVSIRTVGGGNSTHIDFAAPVVPDGVTVPADDCVATAGGCNPTGLHEFTLPDSFVPPPGATITQTVVPVLDSRADANGRCDGQTPQVLFDGELIIPAHLCGSPEFQVIVTETNFDILEDTISNTVFPDQFVSNPIDCNIPIVGDPQLQSAFVWQPTDSADVIEGSAIALTNDCGSSRGRVRGFSYIVVGLHIDFGLDFDSDPQAVTQAFVDLTSTKLNTLLTAVRNARPALKRRDFLRLYLKAYLAERLHNRGRYYLARRFIQGLLSSTERARFDTSAGFNHEGNLLSRADHIEFLLDEFIIPVAR